MQFFNNCLTDVVFSVAGAVFDFDPGFQEDPNQEFTESDLDEEEEEDASSANGIK